MALDAWLPALESLPGVALALPGVAGWEPSRESVAPALLAPSWAPERLETVGRLPGLPPVDAEGSEGAPGEEGDPDEAEGVLLELPDEELWLDGDGKLLELLDEELWLDGDGKLLELLDDELWLDGDGKLLDELDDEDDDDGIETDGELCELELLLD